MHLSAETIGAIVAGALAIVAVIRTWRTDRRSSKAKAALEELSAADAAVATVQKWVTMNRELQERLDASDRRQDELENEIRALKIEGEDCKREWRAMAQRCVGLEEQIKRIRAKLGEKGFADVDALTACVLVVAKVAIWGALLASP